MQRNRNLQLIYLIFLESLFRMRLISSFQIFLFLSIEHKREQSEVTFHCGTYKFSTVADLQQVIIWSEATEMLERVEQVVDGNALSLLIFST